MTKGKNCGFSELWGFWNCGKHVLICVDWAGGICLYQLVVALESQADTLLLIHSVLGSSTAEEWFKSEVLQRFCWRQTQGSGLEVLEGPRVECLGKTFSKRRIRISLGCRKWCGRWMEKGGAIGD